MGLIQNFRRVFPPLSYAEFPPGAVVPWGSSPDLSYIRDVCRGSEGGCEWGHTVLFYLVSRLMVLSCFFIKVCNSNCYVRVQQVSSKVSPSPKKTTTTILDVVLIFLVRPSAKKNKSVGDKKHNALDPQFKHLHISQFNSLSYVRCHRTPDNKF